MYQGLKNVIDDYVKDSKNEEKKNKLYNILINIYIEEFNDSLQNILKENPNIFIDNFKLKMINLLYDIISDKLESNDLNNLLLKVEEKINEIYKNSYLEIKNEYSNNMINCNHKITTKFCFNIK
jgi:GTP1/Obg family GTP-binding protein